MLECYYKNFEMHTKIIDKRIENKNGTIVSLKLDKGKELNAKPGQFLMVWIPEINEKPFSISRISDDYCEITIAKIGNFSENLINKKIKDSIGIRGPFGNGFKIGNEKKILVIAGGIGLAPLVQLAEIYKNKNFTFVVGSKTKNELFFIDRINGCKNTEIFISTDDGSEGYKGYVTDLAEEIINTKNENFDLIIACGKMEMLKNVYKISKKYSINIEISAESFMKCAMGICGSCAIGKFLVCKDGPVFMNKDAEYIMNHI